MESKSLKETIESIYGNPKTAYYDCIIAISENGESILLKSSPNLFSNELFDDCLLKNNLSD